MAEAPGHSRPTPVAGTTPCVVSNQALTVEEYECKICYNNFDLGRRIPKILECSHTFCEDCLSKLHLHEGQRRRIPCPVCRHRTPVPEFCVQNLPNNTELTRALPLTGKFDSLSSHLAVIYTHRHADAWSLPEDSSANSNNTHESNPIYKKVAITMCCVCAIVSPLTMLVLLFVGIIFVHHFNDSTYPIGLICLSVGSVLAMVSVVLAWLVCWLKSPHESAPSDSNVSR